MRSCFGLLRHNAAELPEEHLLNVNQSSSVPLEAESNTTDDAAVGASQSGSDSLDSSTNTEHESEIEPTRLIGLFDVGPEEEETEMQFRSVARGLRPAFCYAPWTPGILRE
jgi:hypothetical protein